MNRNLERRLAAAEKARPPAPSFRSKAKRDAAVAAVLDDPERVRGTLAKLVDEENADGRTAAFMSRRAAVMAAMRADT